MAGSKLLEKKVVKSLCNFLDVDEKFIQIEKFQSRYFSSVLLLFALNQQKEKIGRFFVKLPKKEMQRNFIEIPPRRIEDIALAELEYKTFLQLKDLWKGSYSKYIQPKYLDKSLGAIVFPSVEGEDLCSNKLRTQLLLRRVSEEYYRAFQVLGADIARFHLQSLTLENFNWSKFFSPLEEKVQSLASVIGRMMPDEIGNIIQSNFSSKEEYLPFALSIKGFEIRNVMRVGEDEFYLFDPGKLKREPIYADLARFLVSCRLIFWGTKSFIFPPHAGRLESKFLESYDSVAELNLSLLSLFIVKEILKEWLIKRKSVLMKWYPPQIQKLFLSLYVDRPFSSILHTELARIPGFKS